MNKLILLIITGIFLTAFTEINVTYEPSNLKNTEMESSSKPALIHTVYFWTKEGTTEAQLKAFEKGLVKLGTCPQIASFNWGPPAPTEARGVVDNSYTFAINVHFNSVADEKAYQTEPIHLAFIEAHKDIWSKVIVYDNLVN